MTEPLASKKSLALIENFRSPDGVRAHVFKSNLGGDAIVIIEADTVGGDEAEVTLGCHEVAALHDWLGRALGLSAAPPSPQSPIATLASKQYVGDSFVTLIADMTTAAHAARTNQRDGVAVFVEQWIDRLQVLTSEIPLPQPSIESVTSNERLTLPWRIEWRNSPIADTGDYDCVLSIQASNGETVVDSWNPGDYVEKAFQKIVHAVNAHEWNKRAAETPTPQSPVEPLLLELREFVEQVGSMSVYTQQIRRTQLLKDIDTAVAIAAKAPQSITINGFQARMLMKFADAEDDCYMEVARLPARKSTDGEDMEAGLYVWMTEYPQEGCLLLTEEPTEQGFCSESAKAPAAEPRELSASEAQSFNKAFASSPRRLAAKAKAQLPEGHWWCPHCRIPVPGLDVTYDETHDVRAGGCGYNVVPEIPPVELRAEQEEAAGDKTKREDWRKAGEQIAAAIPEGREP